MLLDQRVLHGSLSYLKPSVLELGGNDAFVVCDHANTDAMVANAVASQTGVVYKDSLS